jgi:outer membrane protein OmpA-like peptidoglycan-associated protein
VGVGYAYLDYDKYSCETCGDKLGSETRNWFGPTKAGITLIYSFGGKSKPTPSVPVYVAPVVREPEPVKEIIIHQPQFTVSFVTPDVETVKQRSEAGRAFLDFAVGRSEIVPSFKDNAAELQKIYGLIERVREDSYATITGITITGYASPEGSYHSNLTLSQKRADALKSRIKTLYGFPEALFTVEGKGEDWATLDTLVGRSAMADRYAVLEIIRGSDIFDAREKKLMTFSGGNPYRDMKANLFPQLRRTEYELHYTVLPFTVEKGKEVFRTNPGNLSLNEMFLIANTYAPGSDAFNELFETAARIFPADDTANLNAAASALDRKDTVSAARYLERVTNRDAAYWNNAGILAYMQGDLSKAAECFATARRMSSAQAAGNAGELDRHIRSEAKE